MFSGAQNFVVSNGQFIDQNIDAEATGIDILLEASNPDAAYNSSYVEDIADWAVPAMDVDVPLPLFWMKGPAGVGKSAIAQTCVERLQDLGKLGAAFFFSVNGCDKAVQFFPTIAYQLSTEIPDYRSLVNQRIRHDKTIVDKTMAVQFNSLIVEPFQELRRNEKDIGKRIPIFIDGLDECESVDAQCEIIEIIAAAARDGRTTFCWAFFSRPESHIEATFAIADIAQVTCTVQLPVSRDADSEIELYLRSGFENVLRRCNVRMQSQWPSSEDLQTLIQNAGGLFVYAATALRVVAQPGFLPEESLRAILTTSPDRGNISTIDSAPKSPFVELDTFYMVIMRRIPSEILPAVLLLCAILCFSGRYLDINSLGVLTQSNFLGLSELQFKMVCSQLSAVLLFRHQPESLVYTTTDTSRPFYQENPAVTQGLRALVFFEPGGSVSFHHKSFYDFLFCVASPITHNTLFKHCLELQHKYQESYSLQGSGEMQV
ncbi:hypothetical protein P691DRAFT_797269 [Macrolepiota fuliginosa MF-IS2]|uniref:Nephrocystin 3-like N-terminal domain-containing protein n=1 Tax=Macrolepiota fuliginosa MF-IS2 TaxID=1400762 RepID=A0A9P5X4T0_9AGAR|nr:hypothetical protein P691DRAFT_797269 [Macrolepiota fuliginosa MF-IS2]